MKINWWPFAVIIYTDWLPDAIGGFAAAFVVLIRPKYKEDRGIHEHEIQHVRQNWYGLILFHALLYFLVTRYRQWAEVAAFKVQMQYPDRFGNKLTLEGAALRLSDEELYHLGITALYAKELLR